MTTNTELKKIDVSVLKLKTGESVEGTLTKISKRESFDRMSGEMRSYPQYHITAPDKKRVVFMGDVGFNNALSFAGIEVGDYFKAVKLEKEELENGNEVNKYDIYTK